MITAGKSASPLTRDARPVEAQPLEGSLAEDLLNRPNRLTGAFDLFWGSLDLDRPIEVEIKNTRGADGFDSQ